MTSIPWRRREAVVALLDQPCTWQAVRQPDRRNGRGQVISAGIARPEELEVRDELRARLRGSVLVSHTSFDRVAARASTSHSSITTRLKTPNKTRPRTRAKKKSAAPSAQTSDAARRPSGKLGLIVDRLERTAGATIEELVDATGWQKHSVHGALSRLRSAGFAIRL